MPVRVVLDLIPATMSCPPPPRQSGPATSAAVLAAVRDRVSATASARLHDAASPKSFAVTPLLDQDGRVLAHPRPARARIEVGVLHDDLASPVVAALTGGITLRVGHSHWFAPGLVVPFCGSYRALLDGARPVTSWSLELVTPVSFATRRGEGARRQRILPDPERVFGTLASRWRALAGQVGLPDGLDEVIRDRLELVDCHLDSTQHLAKAGTPLRRGCVGRVRYAVADAAGVAEPVLAALDALTTFALVAGVGEPHRRRDGTRPADRQGLTRGASRGTGPTTAARFSSERRLTRATPPPRPRQCGPRRHSRAGRVPSEGSH